MLKMIKKFFGFCNEKNRKKFYLAALLGVIEAIFTAMKIPAAFVAMKAVLDDKVDLRAILTVIGLMMIGTLGKTVVSRFSTMLQTEGGYDTCASKRIEIAERLRYLPMGYFNKTSLGHITSVTTNTMEQTGDVATRAIMMVLQGGITTVVVALFMLAFDWRIGLLALAGIGVFLLFNQWTNRCVLKVADEKLTADREMVGVILEYVQGIAEIRNYNVVGQNRSRVQKSIERKKKADIKSELTAIPAVGVQNLIVKLIGVVIAGASILFYLNGSMGLIYTITMLLCSFMVFESLDMAGTYTALLKIIGKGVDLADEILETEQMNINGEKIEPEKHDIELVHGIDKTIAEGDAAFSIAVFDVNGLKNVNDDCGHETGDGMLTGAAACIEAVFGKKNVFRIGGDEFIAVLPDYTETDMEEAFRKLDEHTARVNAVNDGTDEATISFSKGAATFRPGADTAFRSVFKRADVAMYRDKDAYYRDHGDLRRRS